MSPCGDSATPTGEMKLLPFAGNPSVSLVADSLSLRLGHGAALICHRHIIHYRAATSLPLTQGSLLVDAMPEFGMKGVAGDGDAEPSAACGGCSEAEHPQRSKKSSKRTAQRFFRAPQGGRDCDWPRRTRNPGRRERAWDCGWPKRWANRQKIYVDFTKYGISP